MKTPRVYVAGSSLEIDRVKAACEALRQRGVEPLAGWVKNVEANGGNPRDASPADRRKWARGDLNELTSSQSVLVLVPSTEHATRGAWFEAGAAWYAAAPMVFAGDTKQSIFCALGLEYDNDELAIVAAVGLATVGEV